MINGEVFPSFKTIMVHTVVSDPLHRSENNDSSAHPLAKFLPSTADSCETQAWSASKMLDTLHYIYTQQQQQ